MHRRWKWTSGEDQKARVTGIERLQLNGFGLIDKQGGCRILVSVILNGRADQLDLSVKVTSIGHGGRSRCQMGAHTHKEEIFR